MEANLGSLSRVVGTASDCQGVDSTVHFSVGWSNNSSVPVSERLIISLVKTVGYALVRERTFFSFFKLFVKPERSRDYNLVRFAIEKTSWPNDWNNIESQIDEGKKR